MDEFSSVRAVAMGRGLFVDMWALLGFEPVTCDDPLNVEGTLRAMDADIGVILVEEEWFKKMPERVKKIAMRSIHPVWVLLPDMEAPNL
jgi:vacuolar-type H+-ATPase subunit F/Vma7